MAWNPNEYTIKQAIMEGAYQGKEITCNDSGFIQKISVDDDGTADVDWYAPSNSVQKHWHFVFRLDRNGTVIPGSGRLVHS